MLAIGNAFTFGRCRDSISKSLDYSHMTFLMNFLNANICLMMHILLLISALFTRRVSIFIY